MKYYLVKPDGTAGAILYDGVSPYTPPAGCTLMTQSDYIAWRQNNPEPEPELPWPIKVGSGQIRAALIALGWVAVQDQTNPDASLDEWALGLINQMQDPQEKIIATVLWHNASEFLFENPFIEFAANAAEPPKTLQDRKQLFRVAETF